MGIRAYVLIKTNAGRTAEILEKVRKFSAVEKAHMVTGIYDIILFLSLKDLQTLGEVVTEKIHGLNGVSSTVATMVVA